MYYNITIFFTICCRTYWMHRQYYGSENFSQLYNAIKSGPFEGFSNRSNVDELVFNSTSGCNYNKLTVHYQKTRRSSVKVL